eukprot:TRINITY_DN1638_c0_g1_i5.p1 TRINITY_DN1638_c0_g1~~TRINITY_DN1638_c0_g1_i5.p1  ORF type:complete len:275 (+),score=47.44 TRINITY_DN1638_c0_g1_i5:1936-2760(+)
MYVLCQKLKAVKQALRAFHHCNYSNIACRIKEARQNLMNVQHNMQVQHTDQGLYLEEKSCFREFKRLLRAESLMLKQRSKVAWINDGDSNSAFFRAQMRRKKTMTNIHVLFKEDGTRLDAAEGCKEEMLGFYQNLLGSSAPGLPVDNEILRSGAMVSEDQCMQLCSPITDREIHQALHNNPDEKAPGPDGFSEAFFKAWTVIGGDFRRAVKNFFSSGQMLGAVNSTTLVLIPKKTNSKLASEFRPIACCNVLYKCFTNILTVGLKGVMSSIVSQ